MLVIDDDKVFTGSANLDPRSLRVRTEMELLVESGTLNAQVREAVNGDFDPRNARRLEIVGDGGVYRVSANQPLDSQPAASFMQRIERLVLHAPADQKRDVAANQPSRSPAFYATNCSSSVLPARAVVEDKPSMIVFCTASK